MRKLLETLLLSMIDHPRFWELACADHFEKSFRYDYPEKWTMIAYCVDLDDLGVSF